VGWKDEEVVGEHRLLCTIQSLVLLKRICLLLSNTWGHYQFETTINFLLITFYITAISINSTRKRV
jgi:hypothetical protein